jgi:hypothetical protein
VASPSFLTRLTEQHRFRYYDLCLSFFVVVLLISNLVAPKICQIGPFTLSGAQLLFPLTYIFGDIFTEVYGYARSRRAIWHGFLAQTLLTTLAMTIVQLPPAPGWENQQAFETVFGFLPRLVVASLDRLLVRRVCQLLRDGEDEGSHQGPDAVGAHDRVYRRGPTGRYRHRHDCRLRGHHVVGVDFQPHLVRLRGEGRLRGGGHAGDLSGRQCLEEGRGVDLYDTDTDFNPFARMS